MPTPTYEGDIVLGTASSGIMVRNDRDLAVTSTTSGTFWAWCEDFNWLPPVQMAINDVPVVYDHGVRPGGDVAQTRPYQFEFWAEWTEDAGLIDLLDTLTTVAEPLATGTTELSFMVGGVVWTVDGRYEPFSVSRSDLTIHQRIASILVRFRATDPRVRTSGHTIL